MVDLMTMVYPRAVWSPSGAHAPNLNVTPGARAWTWTENPITPYNSPSDCGDTPMPPPASA
jgi:hypothetical protein